MLNLNDWGVPFAEEQNAITTARAAVVRICSRIEPHTCDYMGDPLSEIGGAVDSWSEGDGENKAVYARAEVKDSVAAQKIEDGVWKSNWSVFINYQSIDAGGWLHGVSVESITIVNDPAWPSATWKVVSASSGGGKRLMFTTPFKVSASNSNTIKTNKEGGKIPKTPEELEKEIEDLKKENEKLKAEAPAGNGGGDPEASEEDEGTPVEGNPGPVEGDGEGEGSGPNTETAALKAENEKLKKQVNNLTASNANMMPPDKVKALIDEAIRNDHSAQAAKKERDEAYIEFAAVRESLKMKTDPKDFESFGASELKKFTADLAGLKQVAASKGSGFNFVSASGAKGGSTVGRWDSEKKQYVNAQ
jgi:hypothetical protein